MQKKEVFKFEDSNIAGLGTDLDHKCREAAAATEKAWAVAGKKAGMQIWRIENFKVVPSKTPAGTFYSDDSYICLNTYKKKDANGKELEALGYDIHFWLGQTTSQDESGTAAYKTVELDDFLHGAAVQHREVQGFESPQFLGYFASTGGVRLLEGGVGSGFHHVEHDKYQPRLMHLRGRKNIRVTQVPILASSFNEGDVFVLDMGLTVLQWQGTKATYAEKARAAQLCEAISAERGGRPKHDTYTQTGKDVGEFWSQFKDLDPDYKNWKGGIPTIKADDGKDHEWEKGSDLRMFKLTDATGDLKCSEVTPKTKGAYKKAMLETKDVVIFDAGNEVFVWVGAGASTQEKREAMKYAHDYLVNNKRPVCLPITKILEGGDNTTFNSFFSG